MITPLRNFAQHCKRFSPLVAAPAALLLSQGQAKAVLTYNIFESTGNLVIQTSGSLNLSNVSGLGGSSCGAGGAFSLDNPAICTGPNATLVFYNTSGPNTFGGNGNLSPASTVSGISTIFNVFYSIPGFLPGLFFIGSSYVSNTPIVSSATFNGTDLATLGFTTPGLIGTWTIDGTSETINVVIGAPSAAAVPGPLPLLGAGAAFGWSRRLRKRISTPLSTPPQA